MDIGKEIFKNIFNTIIDLSLLNLTGLLLFVKNFSGINYFHVSDPLLPSKIFCISLCIFIAKLELSLHYMWTAYEMGVTGLFPISVSTIVIDLLMKIIYVQFEYWIKFLFRFVLNSLDAIDEANIRGFVLSIRQNTDAEHYTLIFSTLVLFYIVMCVTKTDDDIMFFAKRIHQRYVRYLIDSKEMMRSMYTVNTPREMQLDERLD